MHTKSNDNKELPEVDSAYLAWRINYQSSEQASRAAFKLAQYYKSQLEEVTEELKGCKTRAKTPG